jgi:hypothetical protein
MDTTLRYEGKILDGKPFFAEPVALPENAKIMIVVEPSLAGQTETLTPAQRNAAKRFLQTTQEIREQGFTEDDQAALANLNSAQYKYKHDMVLNV